MAMNAEHLLHGTEPLLRAAVFLVDLAAGASDDIFVDTCGARRLVPSVVD